MATTKLWTIEDVAALPDDGYRYELIKGELYRMPPPKFRHGMLANTFGRHLGNFVAEQGLGAVLNQSGFILRRNPDILLEPDVAFIRSANIPEDFDAYPESPPDLVVEVASPSQSAASLEEKAALYLAAGVRMVLTVDPIHRTVRVRRADGFNRVLTDRDVLDGDDVLPGFRLPIAEIFG